MTLRFTPVFRALGCALFFVLVASGQLAAQVAAEVVAEVDTTAYPTSGRAVLHLKFTPSVALDTPYAVRVELWRSGRRLVRREHSPPVPTREWQPGQPVEYDLPLFFALPGKSRGPIEVHVGFFDAEADAVLAPANGARGRDGLNRMARFELPEATAEFDAALVESTIAAATAEAAKSPAAAWDRLEFAFRRTADYPLKKQLQTALLQVGRMAPAPLGFEEEAIVAARIRRERARYLRQIAGRLYDRGRLFGALILLTEVGGDLQADADRAVLGALNEARRVTKDRDAIAAKAFAATKEQQVEVSELVLQHSDESERLEFAVQLGKKSQKRAVARALMESIEATPGLQDEAEAARRELEAQWLKDVPASERTEADAARNHPCWARTSQRVSHRFVIIGPKRLLAAIPADSLLRFDLAYLYLTDLFGRVPNPEGDRVTVYFKELWEFGGGVGGGKIIDIGRANPEIKKLRIDGSLYYHELTHCIDDTKPIYGGMREGLADFGAAFTQHELGQVAAARLAFGNAKRKFLGDYLERDLEYWRIPNYGPSAGFLLHFIQEYGKQGGGYAWQRYREFFRNYRVCEVKDGRAPTIARAFAFHLVEAFGEAAFEDLRRFRWPLLKQDLAAVRAEQRAATRSLATGALDESPGSPVPRDLAAEQLRREGAGVPDHRLELGVVEDWWVIGPFKREGIDPDAFRFPPELEIDLKQRYASINNNPTWRRPGRKPVTVDDSGWLRFHFSYMDNSAIYALTHVRVEDATEAWFHLRADDDATLFVNDELIGKFDGHRGPLGPWRPGWRTMLPDAIRFRVNLPAGRNKVLLKVRNRRGGSGCSLAIAQRNGMPLPGWRTDAEPAKEKFAKIEVPDPRKWHARLKLNCSRGGAHRKLEATVGKWRVRNKALHGTSTDRGVEWRKYTVRPGFPKDSPSNLAWLPTKLTKGLEAFRFTLDLAPPASAGKPKPPKLCVIFQGDGRRDGLSGWTLILVPRRGRVQARLERYDRLVYQSEPVEFVPDEKKPTRLELVHYGKRLTVRLGDALLFDQAPIRTIPSMERLGIATWGPDLRISAIELRAPGRTR
ncbi:MAG: hypothetical protein NXI31_26235 [bacterium]|nr:hypothetical protein [bacterium]